ncbi:MAG: hypothetical protein AMK72_02025 [Planctomycetes bacterium SM23_25]|nr:MAG: hypothetical protein AMK72_02025 [Planctomycetes bacterium SM23_25]
MQPLTYSDRSEMLRIVESLRGKAPSDEDVVRRTSELLTSHIQAAGFEYALTRNALALCYHLMYGGGEPVTKAARGALLYLTYRDDLFPDDTPGIGLEDSLDDLRPRWVGPLLLAHVDVTP